MRPFLSRLRALISYIKKTYDRVAVAYSGGTDSSVLLYAAVKALGRKNVIACTACLPYVVNVCPPTPMDVKQIRIRPNVEDIFRKDRDEHPCYLCKRAIYGAIHETVGDVDGVMDGTNVSELTRGRPGLRALYELHVDIPLIKCGLGDQTTSVLASYLNLRARSGACSLVLSPEWPDVEVSDPGRLNRTARLRKPRSERWSLSECLEFTIHAPLPERRTETYECIRRGNALAFRVLGGRVTEAVASYFRECWNV
ncbi:hypothetical protein [Methanopyrus sp.]